MEEGGASSRDHRWSTQRAAGSAQDTPSPSPPPLPALRIARAAGPIVVDGVLDDAGWAGAPKVETWFETNPGDNVTPPAPRPTLNAVA